MFQSPPTRWWHNFWRDSLLELQTSGDVLGLFCTTSCWGPASSANSSITWKSQRRRAGGWPSTWSTQQHQKKELHQKLSASDWLPAAQTRSSFKATLSKTMFWDLFKKIEGKAHAHVRLQTISTRDKTNSSFSGVFATMMPLRSVPKSGVLDNRWATSEHPMYKL